MVRTQIYLTEGEMAALNSISKETGKTESELIRTAIGRLIGDLEPRDRLSLLREARGIWRDRTDLPDLQELRRELDSRLPGA
jgi:DNA-binding IclR family transcriptional regulator